MKLVQTTALAFGKDAKSLKLVSAELLTWYSAESLFEKGVQNVTIVATDIGRRLTDPHLMGKNR